MAATLWLCLHFPNLGLEVFARGLSADQAAAPWVLVEPNQPGSTKLVVVLANTAARHSGIQCHTSLAIAQSICPDLVHVERQPVLETNRLRNLAEHLYSWSNQISLAASNTLILEIGRSLRLFGPLPALCAELTASLASLGHHATLGLGHTPRAATLLARQQYPIPDTVPDQATVLAQLQPVPLAQAGFEPKQVEMFRAMGLHRLGQILELPMKPLGRRFGKQLLLTLQQLTGARADPRPVITPRPRFSSNLHLLTDITSTTALQFPMQRLLGELQHWLTRRQLLTHSIKWHLSHPGHAGHAGQHLELNTAQPTLQQKQLMALTRLRLDRGDLIPEVASIRLSVPAKALSPLAQNQSIHSARTDLFNHTNGKTNPDPDALLDLFRARLGDHVCTGIHMQDDHRPEHAFRLVPTRAFPHQQRHNHQHTRKAPNQKKNKHTAADNQHPPSAQSQAKPQPLQPPRPLWLLRQPKPMPVHTITLLQGPERIDVGWWETPTPRDYFVARQHGGSLCWVFRCPQSNSWFLHGLFA